MRIKIALFDFDGTITSKDTFIEFSIYAVGKLRFLMALFCNIIYLVGWKMGITPNYVAKERLFKSLFKGMHINEFNSLCESFSDKIDGMLHPIGIEKLYKHIDEGIPVYVVSASIENWIKPWAKKHGITNVIATKIGVEAAGGLTGSFTSKNCYGKEKVNRIRRELKDMEDYDIWAYGDSEGDDEMLAIADHFMKV